MPRKPGDHTRLKGQLATKSVQLDASTLPFLMAQAVRAGDAKSLSAGIRSAVRVALNHMTDNGTLPAGYILHLLRASPAKAQAYLERYPDQTPEGYQAPAANPQAAATMAALDALYPDD